MSGQTQATMTIVSGPDTYAAGSAVALNDGDYTLTVASTQVLGGLGQALDGDGDGDAGGDLVFAFHRCFGDADGDRDVNGKDQKAFNASLNKRLGQPGYARHFNYDGSNRVDQADKNEFDQRLGTSL